VPPTDCPCTLWTDATTTAAGPDDDAGAVELGVRVRSDKSGYISGVRFYKYSANRGTHIGNLWTASGTKLASATFTGETASGWQQVTFATPVAITANTTYIASYHTSAGRYAATSRYFVSGFDNAPLHALSDGADGPSGVYRYGAASSFPDQTYQSANYWVDVVFTTTNGTDRTPPTVNSVTPAAGATGVGTSAPVTATFSEMVSSASVNTTTFELRDSAGTLVPASVLAGGETPTATLTPTSPLATATTYTATVAGGTGGVKDLAGNAMAASYRWTFTTAPAPPAASAPAAAGCPCSIWNAASTAASGPDADATPVELGFRFRSDESGSITGVRFYKHVTNTGVHVASLWSNTGALLARATFTAESASGWQQVTFAAPVAIAAGTTYVASYHTDAGHYAVSGGYFASGFDHAPLHALQDGVDGPSGVYQYGADSSFPIQTYQSANYWVDVVFAASVGSAPAPPRVTSVSPASGATAVSATGSVTATFSEAMDALTINGSTVELRDPSGALVAATVSYSSNTSTTILQPVSALAAATTYTATVSGGSVDPRVKNAGGIALAANHVWSFTTAAAATPVGTACPCSIWSAATTPAVISTDPSAVDVGVRFRSDKSGYVTAVRFYKGMSNSGVHVGSLWTQSGVLLARATFGSESLDGWQQVSLATPVAIAANTTYVASYHTTTGFYAATGAYFTAASDNTPLHAQRDGFDGSNGIYLYSTTPAFPTESYNATNYWVDVVFTTVVTADTTPPRVSGVTPPAGTPAASVTTVVTATFSEMMAASTFSATAFELRDAGGALVPASVLVGGETPTVTLTPLSPLAYATAYTATVSGAVTDLAGNPLGTPYRWSFTTAAPPTGTCPCSIWPDAPTPPRADTDTQPISIGVKFQSATAGYITALRFYKFAANTGTHVGELWTRGGTRLAVATFTNETASGWQTIALPAPVRISANTTYIASYHTDVGRYAVSSEYFTSGVTSSPLRALPNVEDAGNGVYRYGPVGSFPTETFHSANYWVDVVFDTTLPDTTAPVVSTVTPAPGTSGVAGQATVAATFNEPMNAATIDLATFELRDASGSLVPGTVRYDAAARTATLTPANVLQASTRFTARIKGGAAEPRVKDVAGNALAADATWLFTTAAAPRPTDGPGGPILVVRSAANVFSAYYAEILRAEGLNEFAVEDLANVTAAMLSAYDLVLLGETPLTPPQAAMFTTWANGGGNLIAMRPDKKLGTLLGITDLSSTLSDAYVRVDAATTPGAGIVADAMQFHGDADRYALNGATSVAALSSAPAAATPHPAVTLKPNVGANGGYAAAFTYDLARSIVYTRQGNPAWAGQDRDGVGPIRPNDLFVGAASTGGAPDWVNLDNVAIPQADEQQRLLANLIAFMNRSRKPLPRFWYFPRGAKAVVVMTGEDRVNGSTAARFDAFASASPAGCSIVDWTCVRGTSYLGSNTSITDAAASTYRAAGFEIGPQVSTNCGNWTAASLESAYRDQLTSFAARFPGAPAASTHRIHCSAWSDYATQSQVEVGHGIRLDTSYAYWPDTWLMNRPGFVTGSGLPMRFVDPAGTLVDVYQAAAQMTDNSGQSYPFTVNALLDNALGPAAYYGVFTVSINADTVYSYEADQIVASARARGVPVVAARQMLDWLDGRNGSSFHSITGNGAMLSFSVAVGAGANGLQAMIPTTSVNGSLRTLTMNGNPVAFVREIIKGVEYALFLAAAGNYQASYTP
jgi:hypothetical protein